MIPPNRYYGVRTATTLADEAVWYAANRAFGRDLVALGGATLLLSTALLRTDFGGVAYAVLMSIALGVGAALLAAIGIARVRRL